jgi:hypothetical protein
MPVKRYRAFLFLIAFAVPPASAAVPSTQPSAPATRPAAHDTAQFSFYGDRKECERLGRIGEALWPMLEDYFGGKSEGKVTVHLLEDRKAYLDALTERGSLHDGLKDSRGVYFYRSRSIYVYRQPSDHRTASAFIHEAVHAFDYGTARRRRSSFYSEGIADWFASHRWDGQVLEVGILVTPHTNELRYEARYIFDVLRSGDLSRVPWRTGSPRYAEAWAIVAFLRDYDPDKFGQWERRVMKSFGDAEGAVREVYGDESVKEMSASFDRWLDEVCAAEPKPSATQSALRSPR